jgi:hypothetical protein
LAQLVAGLVKRSLVRVENADLSCAIGLPVVALPIFA